MNRGRLNDVYVHNSLINKFIKHNKSIEEKYCKELNGVLDLVSNRLEYDSYVGLEHERLDAIINIHAYIVEDASEFRNKDKYVKIKRVKENGNLVYSLMVTLDKEIVHTYTVEKENDVILACLNIKKAYLENKDLTCVDILDRSSMKVDESVLDARMEFEGPLLTSDMCVKFIDIINRYNETVGAVKIYYRYDEMKKGMYDFRVRGEKEDPHYVVYSPINNKYYACSDICSYKEELGTYDVYTASKEKTICSDDIREIFEFMLPNHELHEDLDSIIEDVMAIALV